MLKLVLNHFFGSVDIFNKNNAYDDCVDNVSGAFLIPYITMLVLAGIPLYFLEIAIGQYASLGACTVWKLSPVFKGI